MTTKTTTAKTTSKTETTGTKANKVATSKARKTTAEMTKAQAESITKKIKGNLETLPNYILKAMQGKAYKALGYDDMATWSKAEFGLGRSRIYQIVKSLTLCNVLRETFDLHEDWTHTEEHFRQFKGDAFNILVDDITLALSEASVGDDAKHQSKRGTLVSKAVQASWAEYETKKKLAVKALNEATADKTDADTANTADTADTVPVALVSTRIQPVALTPELAKEKALSTAIVFESIANDDSDRERTLMTLNDTMAVLTELIGYYSADADTTDVPVAPVVLDIAS